MTDDVRRTIYTTITVFLVGVAIWIGILFLNACGLSAECTRAKVKVDRTPVPTMIPATFPVANPVINDELSGMDRCQVVASELIGFWVEAGSPKSGAFDFKDANGRDCISSYSEISNLLPNDQLIEAGSIAPSASTEEVPATPAQ